MQRVRSWTYPPPLVTLGPSTSDSAVLYSRCIGWWRRPTTITNKHCHCFLKIEDDKHGLGREYCTIKFFSENSKSAQKEMKHKHKPYPLRSQLFWWNMNFPAPHIINMHKYYLRYLKVKAETLNTCASTSWTKKKILIGLFREVAFIMWSSLILMGGGMHFFTPLWGGAKHFFALVKG